jgi:hypothetical protein
MVDLLTPKPVAACNSVFSATQNYHLVFLRVHVNIHIKTNSRRKYFSVYTNPLHINHLIIELVKKTCIAAGLLLLLDLQCTVELVGVN